MKFQNKKELRVEAKNSINKVDASRYILANDNFSSCTRLIKTESSQRIYKFQHLLVINIQVYPITSKAADFNRSFVQID